MIFIPNARLPIFATLAPSRPSPSIPKVFPVRPVAKLDCNLISLKEHLTTDGLYKLVAIKSAMNKGLSPELEQAFPQVKPNLRPTVNNINYNINPYWLAGFVSAEGCFFTHFQKVGK